MFERCKEIYFVDNLVDKLNAFQCFVVNTVKTHGNKAGLILSKIIMCRYDTVMKSKKTHFEVTFLKKNSAHLVCEKIISTRKICLII